MAGRHPDGTRVVTSRIEADRLAAEELTDPTLDWTVLEWLDDIAAAVPTGDRVGVDVAGRPRPLLLEAG